MAGYTPTAWVNNSTPAISAANLGKIETGIQQAHMYPGVMLDSFTGANDSAKLAAAMSYAAAQTYKPAIMFSNRLYSMTTQQAVFGGMRLVGGYGAVEQVRSGTPIPNQVNVTIGGGNGWLVWPTGTSTFGCYISGLAFQGNSTTRFVHPDTSAVIWTSVFENLSFNYFQSVFGSTATNCALDACAFKGWWNVNNGYDQQFHMGGSDNTFWMDGGCLLDSPPGTITGGTTGANTLCFFAAMSKSTVGPMYITGERVRPLKIDYSNAGQLVFTGTRLEGMPAVPASQAYGAIVRINNGGVTLRDCWTSYGMTSPSTPGYGDGGMIHIAGGNVLIDSCWYQKGNGVADSVPYIYVTGGTVRVRNIMKMGTWSGSNLPIVTNAGGTVDADNSVTVN